MNRAQLLKAHDDFLGLMSGPPATEVRGYLMTGPPAFRAIHPELFFPSEKG
jgi:hypothetical protein